MFVHVVLELAAGVGGPDFDAANGADVGCVRIPKVLQRPDPRVDRGRLHRSSLLHLEKMFLNDLLFWQPAILSNIILLALWNHEMEHIDNQDKDTKHKAAYIIDTQCNNKKRNTTD